MTASRWFAAWTTGVVVAAGAGAAPPVYWAPMGPELILDGQAREGRVQVTGRVNTIAPDPTNPLGEIWLGTSGGGLWRGSIHPAVAWQPMASELGWLSISDLALDNCGKNPCTVWAGTGDPGIRRDTQHGRGVLRGRFDPVEASYSWKLVGENELGFGTVSRVVLDPSTPDDQNKRVFVALSTGKTSNSVEAAITTASPNPLGIWRSDDAGTSWQNVLDRGDVATDLEIDPADPEVLYAAFRRQGLWYSKDRGDSWASLGQGIPSSVLGNADWPTLAVIRTPEMSDTRLYAVLGDCPEPFEQVAPQHCSPAVYRSDDGGSNWVEVKAAVSPPPTDGGPLSSFVAYTDALTVHPNNPDELWYGGVHLYHSLNGGASWTTVGKKDLAPHLHAVKLAASNDMPSGYVFLAATDGGLFVKDGLGRFRGEFQTGLEIAGLTSVSAREGQVLAGAGNQGGNVYIGGSAWLHTVDGSVGSVLFDLDDEGLSYAGRIGVDPRRCSGGSGPSCTAIAGNSGLAGSMPQSPNTAWYPPFAQGENLVSGDFPLYFAGTQLYRNTTNGGTPASSPGWQVLSPPGLGGGAPIAELGGIPNPFTAVGVSSITADRLYVGFYDGQVFTTANALATLPSWTAASSGLPGRPVVALAVSPTDPATVLAAVAGYGSHSLYKSSNAGASWQPFDASLGDELASGPVHTLAIEPLPPYRVWAGTDRGVYGRASLSSAGDIFFREEGSPQTAVYDLKLEDYGATLYAATRGRGLWRRSATPRLDVYYEDCCDDGTVDDNKPFLAVTGLGFEPGRSECYLTLHGESGACASDSMDAQSAQLHTDSRGRLRSSQLGISTGFQNRGLAFACDAGLCISGVTFDSCDVTAVQVDCGESQATTLVQRPVAQLNPSSTHLIFEPKGDGGTLTVRAVLKPATGRSTVLCQAFADYQPTDSAATVLERVMANVASQPACVTAGVTAQVVTAPGSGLEGDGPSPPHLELFAPTSYGVQLITEAVLNGKGKVTVRRYGNPGAARMVTPRLRVTGSGSGGSIEIAAGSSEGKHSGIITSEAGDGLHVIAIKIASVMDGRDLGGGLPIGGTGSPPKRTDAARISASGDTVFLPHVISLEVTVNDSSVGVELGASY